jgi:hypothetical protein
MGTSTMGCSDDPVPCRLDHFDTRRGIQGCGFWQKATATSRERALKGSLVMTDRALEHNTTFTTFMKRSNQKRLVHGVAGLAS